MPVESIEIVLITSFMILFSFLLIYLFSSYTNLDQIYKLIGIYILNNDYNCLGISELYTNIQMQCISSFYYTSSALFYNNSIFLIYENLPFFTYTPNNVSFFGEGFESFIINKYLNSSNIVG